jgi:hypothetical protein
MNQAPSTKHQAPSTKNQEPGTNPQANIKLQHQKSENETDVKTPGLIAGTPGINSQAFNDNNLMSGLFPRIFFILSQVPLQVHLLEHRFGF